MVVAWALSLWALGARGKPLCFPASTFQFALTNSLTENRLRARQERVPGVETDSRPLDRTEQGRGHTATGQATNLGRAKGNLTSILQVRYQFVNTPPPAGR
jgi:hypothetical protein